MSEYNPFLAMGGLSGSKGGGQFLEDPANCSNIVWQARAEHLSDGDAALANALTHAFTDGADDLDACAAALNRQGFEMRTGTAWTAEDLGEHLARLSCPSI